jgi:hypothetical protein
MNKAKEIQKQDIHGLAVVYCVCSISLLFFFVPLAFSFLFDFFYTVVIFLNSPLHSGFTS